MTTRMGTLAARADRLDELAYRLLGQVPRQVRFADDADEPVAVASSSPKEVSIKEATSGIVERMSRHTVTPSPSGSCTSSTATSGFRAGIRASASAAPMACRPGVVTGARRRSAGGGVGVVVDVGLPQVLCLGTDVRLVVVLHGWVIVLVGMSGRHVLPLTAVPEVVHDVSVLVGVHDRVMGVRHGSPLLPCCACGWWQHRPAGRRLARLLPGLVPGTDPGNPLARLGRFEHPGDMPMGGPVRPAGRRMTWLVALVQPLRGLARIIFLDACR